MNLQDYAFLQNMIDCHDRDNQPENHQFSPITDVRNHYQGLIEMEAYRVARPKIGSKYGFYINLNADPFGQPILTNWMGDMFPLRVILGHTWKRYGHLDTYTMQTVYASTASGEQWRGTWSKNWQDLVIMRRLA